MASGDAALWLHNKLGSTDDLWSGKTICSQLSKEKLLSIRGCFFTLQPHVKVKVMLSFLHLPRRNVEEWQKEMEEILALALDDSDHWVSTVAEVLQTFPENGALKLDLDENNVAFAEILTDLKKVVKKNADTRMLPIECQFLNKTALLSVAGQLPQPVKHFALKRKPKSATLRAELLQKSTEVASNKKNYIANAVPVKVRSFAKKIDDSALSKTGITNLQNTLSGSLSSTPVTPVTNNSMSTPTSTLSSNCFLSASSGLTRSNNLTPRATTTTGSLRSKEGGIKLIEIAEQPVGAKEAKRRRKIAEQEAIGQQKKEKEAAATATTATETTTTTYTPDYAAGLVTPVLAKLPTPVGVTSSSSLSTSTPTYVPTTSTRLPTGTTILSVTNASTSTQQARENLQIQLQQHLGQTQTATLITPSTTQSQTLVIQSPGQLSTAPQTVTSTATQVAVSTSTVPAASNQPKKKLFLMKQQMFEAKEMFKVSNKVTRPEKALILGFMAGSRDNPCPTQGDILSIRLSENEEILQQPEGSKKVIVETFFQMNYATGEWKRVRKVH